MVLRNRTGLLVMLLWLGCSDDGPVPSNVTIAAMQVKPGVLCLSTGRMRRLLSELVGTQGERFNVTSTADWTTSDPAILQTQGDGVLIGVAAGTAMATASRDGFSATVPVLVLGSAVTSMAISVPNLSLSPGAMQTVGASAMLAGGGTADVTHFAAWKSANPAVAKVADGVVTAVAPGMTTLIATADQIDSPAVVITVTP